LVAERRREKSVNDGSRQALGGLIFEDKSVTREYLCFEDAVDASVLARPQARQGDDRSQNDIAYIIVTDLGRDPAIEQRPSQAFDLPALVPDSSDARGVRRSATNERMLCYKRATDLIP
jgi:hypothetical protein